MLTHNGLEANLVFYKNIAHQLWPTLSTEGLEYTVQVPICQSTCFISVMRKCTILKQTIQ